MGSSFRYEAAEMFPRGRATMEDAAALQSFACPKPTSDAGGKYYARGSPERDLGLVSGGAVKGKPRD